MGWYEAIKDGINVAQQVDNIPLVQSLIDAQKQILDLISENTNLKEENRKLSEKLEQKSSIERHSDTYITLHSDEKQIKYCATCWDNSQKLVQLSCDDGYYGCRICKNRGYYDKEMYDRLQEEKINAMYNNDDYPDMF